MALPDVFVPSSGELIVRDNLSAGMDHSRRERPATMGGHRFGQLSHNSFFTRHNPQPRRVFHMKGLLDAPICTVNDNGVSGQPLYSLNFPPNGHSESILRRLPVDAINVNSQLHPINTITGLQYFTGLNSYPYKEQFKPIGGEAMDPESWRDFLKSLGEACGIATPSTEVKPEDGKRPLYSAQTGRLIPPPSRATSRGYSRRRSRLAASENFPVPNSLDLSGLSEESEIEMTILRMLCQILQTEDANSVKTWLASAGDTEKNIVVNLLRTALAAKKEYYSRKPSADEQLGDASRSKTAGAELHDSGAVSGDLLGAEPQNRLNTVTGVESGKDRAGSRRSPTKATNRLKDVIGEQAIGPELAELAKEALDGGRKRREYGDELKNDVFQSKSVLPDIVQKPKTPCTPRMMRYQKSGAPASAGLEGHLAAAGAAGWNRSWLPDDSTA